MEYLNETDHTFNYIHTGSRADSSLSLPPPPFSVSIFCLIAVVQKVVENEGGRESSTAETDLLVCLLKIQIRILPPPTQLCFGRVK